MTTTTEKGSGLDAHEFLVAKTDQAIRILKEKGIDVWLTYVRETMANADPSLELVFEGDLTWESALIFTADGEKIAIVGVHDAPELEESGIYDQPRRKCGSGSRPWAGTSIFFESQHSSST